MIGQQQIRQHDRNHRQEICDARIHTGLCSVAFAVRALRQIVGGRHGQRCRNARDDAGERDQPVVCQREGQPRDGAGEFHERVVEPQHDGADVVQPLLVDHGHQLGLVRFFIRHHLPRFGQLLLDFPQIANAEILAFFEKLDRKRDAEHAAEHGEQRDLPAVRRNVLFRIPAPGFVMSAFRAGDFRKHALVIRVLLPRGNLAVKDASRDLVPLHLE